MSESKLITQKQVARMLGVCEATVRRWKECPRVYISPSRCRYSLSAVLAWLESRNTGTPGKEVEV